MPAEGVGPAFARPLGSPGGHTAVDVHDVAGDEACIVRGEKDNGAGDLVGLADPLLGVQRRE